MSPESTSLESAAPPYVDCIQWVPRRFATGQSPVTIADLVFTQAVIKTVRDTVESRPETSVFGLILGEIKQDPTCTRPWVRVNRVIHGPAISGDPSAVSLSQIMDGLVDGLDEPRRVVGWYRSHPGAGLYLSPEEARFHEDRFSDPWGFAVIMVGDAGRLTGSVFQRTDPEGLSRSVYTPFYELVDDSSEFNGTTKRTYVGWPNYQTETRVVQAGQGSVSALIPDGSKALIEAPVRAPAKAEQAEQAGQRADAKDPAKRGDLSATTPRDPTHLPALDLPAEPARAQSPLAEPTPAQAPRVGHPASASREVPAPPASEPAAGRQDVEPDVDVEWEKKQIQRSLTAVGRSIGTTALGDLSTPVTVDLEPSVVRAGGASDADPSDPGSEAAEGDPEARAAVSDGSQSANASAGDAWSASESRTVIPLHADSGMGRELGMVGRARRHTANRPIGKILSAAAGLVLILGAGWFGSRMMRAQPVNAENEAGSSGSAAAGLGLAPTDLFREESGSAPVGQPAIEDPADSAEEALDPGDSLVVSFGPVSVFESIDASQPGLDAESAQQAERGSDPDSPRVPRPLPPEPDIVAAPALEGIEVEDPDVSAFRNALEIFRSEVQRYERQRTAFDAGESSCNPLNLAHRGVRDSFQRLDNRFQIASERFAGAELRAFDGARREHAMIQTHYSLTDCPISP